MKNKIISVLKWLWLIAVCVFIIFFIRKNFADLKEAINRIHISYLLLSFLCIAGAKILLVLFMRYVLRSVGKEMNFPTCFRIYNISQLGKYIPGNIWHFVGKAAAYKDNGFSIGAIRDALVIENLWLVGGAFAYGLALMVIFNSYLIQHLFFSHRMYVAVFFVAVLLLLFLGNKVLKVNFRRLFSSHRLNVKIIFLQIVIWSLLGLSFAVLTIPFIHPMGSTILMISGLYAIAYSFGFVTPFAPAGIGVREAVLAVGLLPYLPLRIVITLSAANRLLYLLVEIILAVLSRVVVLKYTKS
jgi:glycosyltransferase 2 family protein